MRDKDNRLTFALPDTKQQLLHQATRLVVQCTKRFIEQKNFWIVSKGPGYGCALLHSSRQLFREMVFKATKANFIDIFRNDGIALILRNSTFSQAESNIFSDVEPREKCVGLKHHTPIRTRAGYGFFIKHNPTCTWHIQSGDNTQQGRFATTGWPENGNELIAADCKIRLLQCANRLST